jgi:hypothetical protein
MLMASGFLQEEIAMLFQSIIMVATRGSTAESSGDADSITFTYVLRV